MSEVVNAYPGTGPGWGINDLLRSVQNNVHYANIGDSRLITTSYFVL